MRCSDLDHGSLRGIGDHCNNGMGWQGSVVEAVGILNVVVSSSINPVGGQTSENGRGDIGVLGDNGRVR